MCCILEGGSEEETELGLRGRCDGAEPELGTKEAGVSAEDPS